METRRRRRPGAGQNRRLRSTPGLSPLILGLDPGQRRDPAALAAVAGFDVVHLERVPLGTSYVALAERVAAVALAAEGCTVVVDATGARPFLDMLEARGLAPIAVTLTGGGRVHVRDREVSLPRASLFTPVVAAMEAGRLRVAEGCPFRAELAAELLGMRATARGADGRGPGHHSDLAVSLALCLWWQGAARAQPLREHF